jgi:hypothetical protein
MHKKPVNSVLVVACPRSGSSLTMDIQRLAHGDDAILGNKISDRDFEKAMKEEMERRKDEEDHEYRVRHYLLQRQLDQQLERQEKRQSKTKDMNPNGFWEMEFTVAGISPYRRIRGMAVYSQELQDILDDIEAGTFKVFKVVSQGLLQSNPRMIGKIIYVLRHPRAVAKSQERLSYSLELPDPETGEIKNLSELIKITTPKMFIEVTAQAARFLLDHPEIPVRFYHFEQLVRDPAPILQDMQEFVGRGDYSKALSAINPKLSRSNHAEVESDLLTDAEYVYEKFCKAAEVINAGGKREEAGEYFKAIHTYLEDPHRLFNRQRRRWPCFRMNHMVTEKQCHSCMTEPIVRENAIKGRKVAPIKNETPWEEEPCLFECGMDLDRDKYLTIEESIRRNFWKAYTEAELKEMLAEKV